MEAGRKIRQAEDVMKKQWISVKCGLSRDPKHRQSMGESVWVFLHMLDIVTWEDGIVRDWKDEAAAEDLGMPVRTLREHRRKLSELEYITCRQKQYTQDIVIHNWTNPREYSGRDYNKKQGDRIVSPEDYTQGDTQGSRKDVTPTSNSNNKQSKRGDLVDGYLQLLNSPGLKRQARLDAILSYLGGKLQINTETARWKKFAKFVDNRQQTEGENIETFVTWLLSQEGFDIMYWSPMRCEEMWTQAFIVTKIPAIEYAY